MSSDSSEDSSNDWCSPEERIICFGIKFLNLLLLVISDLCVKNSLSLIVVLTRLHGSHVGSVKPTQCTLKNSFDLGPFGFPLISDILSTMNSSPSSRNATAVGSKCSMSRLNFDS